MEKSRPFIARLAFGALVVGSIFVGPVLFGSGLLGSNAAAQGQSILGPGLYVFQTRTRSASCGDDERTGYVSTFVAPIHGVPGDRTMRMQLLNTEYWPTWQLAISTDDHIVGEAHHGAAENHFDVTPSGERFTGRGYRTYRANGHTCRVEYDALLRRIDQL